MKLRERDEFAMEEEKKDKVVEKKEEKVAVKTEKAPKKEDKKETKKKFDNPKEDNKKSKTTMIVTACIAALVIIAIIAGILVFTSKSPKRAVEDMFNKIKIGNMSQSILSGLSMQGNFNQDVQNALVEKLDYKILNVKEEGDTATVEVEVTNKDFKTIMNNYMQKVIKIAFSGSTPSEEESTNYLMEELNNSEVQVITQKQNIIVNKQDGKWTVSDENDMANILLPGFNEAMQALR